MINSVPRISVIHIVWKPFGVAALENFLRSYERHEAGAAHRLICLFKGFRDESDSQDFCRLLRDVRHEKLFIEDRGYDIGAYLSAASRVHSDFYCFLNSRSVILAGDWLRKLFDHASKPDVGVAGATASCESLYTDHVRDRRLVVQGSDYWRRLIRTSFMNRVRHLYYYPPFPNFHVRTNAFMMRNEILGRIEVPKIRSRRDTSRFENGRNSLTRQIFRMNLQAVVVGSDGTGYRPAECGRSATFWQGNQENLLMADNQTEKYRAAAPEQKSRLTSIAWG